MGPIIGFVHVHAKTSLRQTSTVGKQLFAMDEILSLAYRL